MTGLETLQPSMQPIARALIAAKGAFVDGRSLAKAGHIPFDHLPNYICRIRKLLAGVVIEGKRGSGYRIVTPQADAPPPGRWRTAPSQRNDANAARDRVAELAPGLVEAIGFAALDEGETLDKFSGRLIAYGWEVYRDLLATGERP